MRYLVLFFSLICFDLFSQGIEPTSFQPTPYKGGVLIGVIENVDEFTGDTSYIYQHSDTVYASIDSLVFTDSLRLYTNKGVFSTYLSFSPDSIYVTTGISNDTIRLRDGSGFALVSNINEIQELRTAGSGDVNLQITQGGGVGIQNTLTNILVPSNGTNGNVLTKGSGTNYSWLAPATNGTVTSVTGTSPIIITGTPTITPNVTIQNATTAQNGALTSTDWNVFNSKVGGSGTTNYIPKWSSGSILTFSQAFDDGTTYSIGASGVPNSAGLFEAKKGYTNTSDVNILASGNIPMIGWNKTFSYRWAMGSGYAGNDMFSFLGASATSSNPTTELMRFSNIGDINIFQNLDIGQGLRCGSSSSEFSFNHHTANPTDVQFYVSLQSGKRFRIQAASSLAYMDFYTPATGLNRNYSFATSYGGNGDFVLLKSSTAGGVPNTNIFTATDTGFGIGTLSPARKFHVDGEARITDLITDAPTRLIGADADGDLNQVTLGSGISLSSGTLYNTGVLTEIDGSITNEIQTISTSGAAGNISISSGNTININVNDADASTTNELQNLYFNPEVTGYTWMDISGGSGVYFQEGTGIDLVRSGSNVLQVNSTVTGSTGTVTSVTGTSPIIITGTPTVTPNVTIQNASTSTTGALTSTDWNVFNSKVDGSGAATRVAFWNGTSSLSSSSNLYWSNTNSRLGIGTSSPSYNLDVVGNARVETYMYGSDGEILSGQDASGVYYTFGGAGPAKPIYFSNGNTTFIQVANLAGSGTRMVTAGPGGILSTQAVPTGTVTSVATTNGITGGTITSTGTVQLTGQASALHNLGTNGLIARTGSGTVAARTITAGAGITVTNGDGVSGNPTIAKSSPSYAMLYTDGHTIQSISTAGSVIDFNSSQASGITSSAASNTITLPTGVYVISYSFEIEHTDGVYCECTNGGYGLSGSSSQNSGTYEGPMNISKTFIFSGSATIDIRCYSYGSTSNGNIFSPTLTAHKID